MKAKAAVLTGVNQPFAIREYDLVPAPAGLARLKLIASGICGTDQHIQQGKIPSQLPALIGHEFVGQVEEINLAGKKTGVRPGDNVIVYIACPCGKCRLCQDGDEANCVNMTVTNAGDPGQAPHFYGGFAEYNYSPLENLVVIPAGLDPYLTAVFACAGPTTLHAAKLAHKANIRLDQARIAVVQGLGPVGMFSLLYLQSLGIEHIIAISGRSDAARAELTKKLGATKVFALDRTGPDQINAYVRSLADGIGADLVIEASGNPQAVPQGLALLRNRGTYLVPGQYSNSGDVAIAPQQITFNALRVIGSSQYDLADIDQYLVFLQENPDLHDLIRSLAKSYPVSAINQAFAEQKDNIKTLLVP
jgi:threonine dehydrogenase-like Zn-dependent dehydrogenase